MKDESYASRFLCREEDWGYLLQDMDNDRLWGVSHKEYQRIFMDRSSPLWELNPYRYSGDFFIGKHSQSLSLSAPISVSWSITSSCNSRCVFCCTDSINQATERNEATLNQIEQTLDALASWNVMRIVLGGGEPLTRPDFLDILQIFRSRSIRPVLATNGILLTSNLLQAAVDTCMNLQISLDTLSSETYHSLRGVDALKDVTNHLCEAAESGALVRVVTVVTSKNINELPQIGNFLGRCGVRQWFIYELLRSGRAVNNYEQLHVRRTADIKSLADRLQQVYPNLSVWYWGSKSADGCSVYISPDGTLELVNYHTNSFFRFPCSAFSLSSAKKYWEQVAPNSKQSILENFLSKNRTMGDATNV